jgi:hypothetical protein
MSNKPSPPLRLTFIRVRYSTTRHLIHSTTTLSPVRSLMAVSSTTTVRISSHLPDLLRLFMEISNKLVQTPVPVRMGLACTSTSEDLSCCSDFSTYEYILFMRRRPSAFLLASSGHCYLRRFPFFFKSIFSRRIRIDDGMDGYQTCIICLTLLSPLCYT